MTTLKFEKKRAFLKTFNVAGFQYHEGPMVFDRLANPTARAMIETLDHVQRTNTIGTLSAEDVSRTITAPTVIARNSQAQQQAQQKVIHVGVDTSQTDATLREVSTVIAELKRRLDEPFVTVNSVTGDLGMKQAQDEYERLMRNKSPK